MAASNRGVHISLAGTLDHAGQQNRLGVLVAAMYSNASVLGFKAVGAS